MNYYNSFSTISNNIDPFNINQDNNSLRSMFSENLCQQQLQEENFNLKQQNELLLSENLLLKKQLNRLQEQIRQYQNQQALLEQNNYELQCQAHLDSLTQVANRRSFDKTLERYCAKNQSLSLLLIDIDYFKQFNDTYGHQAGDRCLIRVAQALVRVAKRSEDLVARYGGEEFAIILPHTDAQGAMHIAELLQKELKQLKIYHKKSKVSSLVTVSIGIATSTPDQPLSSSALIKKADQTLYSAKEQGRDRICSLE